MPRKAAPSSVPANQSSMCGQCSARARTIPESRAAPCSRQDFLPESCRGRHIADRASKERRTVRVPRQNETAQRRCRYRRMAPAMSHAKSTGSPGTPAPNAATLASKHPPSRIPRQPTSPPPRLAMCPANRTTPVPVCPQTAARAERSRASSDRAPVAGPKILLPTYRARRRLRMGRGPAVCIARKTNIPEARAAGSAAGQHPRGDNASESRQNPSNTLLRPRSWPKQRRSQSPEFHSSQESSDSDNRFTLARL